MEYLQLSSDIHIFTYPNGGVVYHNKTKREYTIGIEELYVLNEIREHTVAKAEDLKCDISLQKIQLIIEKYKELGILYQEDVSVQIKRQHKFFLGLSLLRNTPINKRLECFRFKAISNLILILPIILLLILLIMLINGHFIISMKDLVDKDYLIYNLFGFLFCLFIPTLGHELSHAIVAKRYNCHIVEAGVILRGIFLCFYVRIVGLGMNNKKEKLFIYLAGMLFNISSLLGALIISQLLSKQIILKNLMLLCTLANAEMIMSNSLCIFRLDGHKVLQELLNKWSLKKCFYELSFREKIFIVVDISICSSVIVVSLLFNLIWLPPFVHIVIALSILWLFRYEKRCIAYCFLILGYGVVGSFILLGYQLMNHLPYPLMNCIFFLLCINISLVWLGTLFYLVNEQTLKMKIFSKGVL